MINPLGEGWGEGHERGLTIIYKKVYGSEICVEIITLKKYIFSHL